MKEHDQMLNKTAQGPLSDIRVIEMGQLIAGPFCGQLLADFGAEVIKIEQPDGGDPMREWGREKPHGRSLWFPVIARGKKSVTLDLRQPKGQELARRLIGTADVVVENFRPGTMERWGLGYDALAALNPGLVMVRVSGFGQTGPYARRAGYGAIGEAMGGLRYVCGEPDRPPSRVGFSIGDSLAGTFGCIGALIALHARARTGCGQVVDSAIYEAVLAMTENLVTEYAAAGYVRRRSGSSLPNIAPSNAYPTRDGTEILIAANQDTVFRRLCQAMGRAALADDPRYATHTARGENQVELDQLIADWSGTMAIAELETLLESNGVPAGRIYSAPDMLADPHFAAREAITRIADPILGELAMQNVAPRLSRTPGHVTRTAPLLGADSAAVLSHLLGIDAAEMAELRAGGIVGGPAPAAVPPFEAETVGTGA
ncbi:CoA transferase [Ancylobacter pratisalsi]|uniref:CoA transferase n=2 Tax=Ancylobacter pratisalsi TaxID=1745854 RepID=A0A6P1YIY8_9HYPH|nr:CoA transferase [Ancylobacter pratisalsi]